MVHPLSHFQANFGPRDRTEPLNYEIFLEHSPDKMLDTLYLDIYISNIRKQSNFKSRATTHQCVHIFIYHQQFSQFITGNNESRRRHFLLNKVLH